MPVRLTVAVQSGCLGMRNRIGTSRTMVLGLLVNRSVGMRA